jgi:hypothetical protein
MKNGVALLARQWTTKAGLSQYKQAPRILYHLSDNSSSESHVATQVAAEGLDGRGHDNLATWCAKQSKAMCTLTVMSVRHA